jgi:TM2 domain-containing membrane protein YozV
MRGEVGGAIAVLVGLAVIYNVVAAVWSWMTATFTQLMLTGMGAGVLVLAVAGIGIFRLLRDRN